MDTKDITQNSEQNIYIENEKYSQKIPSLPDHAGKSTGTSGPAELQQAEPVP